MKEYIYEVIHHYCYFLDTVEPSISALSLHDALPISGAGEVLVLVEVHRERREVLGGLELFGGGGSGARGGGRGRRRRTQDRKSTRLNSSHVRISYAVFCLKKKNLQAVTSCHNTPGRL